MMESEKWVMDNRFFVISLMFIGLAALFGLIVIPFLVIYFLLWYWWRSDW
jgi:hypothetical protein